MEEALTLENCRVKNGRLISVYNKDRHVSAKMAYKAVWVEDSDGSNKRCLLFTDHELEKAEERAEKNKEDLPQKGFFAKLFGL